MSKSLVFKQDPKQRTHDGAVTTTELGEEIILDMLDAFSLATRANEPELAEAVFTELRALRRDRWRNSR